VWLCACACVCVPVCVWLCACVIDARDVESRSVRRANCWSDRAALPPAVAARNTQRADCNIQCSMQHAMQHATCNAACNMQCSMQHAMQHATYHAACKQHTVQHATYSMLHAPCDRRRAGRARTSASARTSAAAHACEPPLRVSVRVTAWSGAGREYIRAHELRELRSDAYQQRRRRLGPP
jgi:hypothetical protein